MTVMVGGAAFPSFGPQGLSSPSAQTVNTAVAPDEFHARELESHPVSHQESHERELESRGTALQKEGARVINNSSTLPAVTRARVIVAQLTGARTCSAPVPASLLQLHLSQKSFTPQEEVEVSTAAVPLQALNGELLVEGVPVAAWLPLLPLAEDVHTETARLALAGLQQDHVQLVLTRDVPKGQSLRLWFSSDVAAQLGLPFLNFTHIRGKEYVCPHCQSLFRAPNPLKLHLARSCDTLAPGALWARMMGTSSVKSEGGFAPWTLPYLLAGASRANEIVRLLSHHPSSGDSTPRTNTEERLRIPDAGSDAININEKESKIDIILQNNLLGSVTSCTADVYRSAFRPVVTHVPHRTEVRSVSLKESESTISYLPLPSFTNLTLLPKSLRANAAFDQFLNKHLPLTSGPALPPSSGEQQDPCAEVESVVSSLGRGRSGHICLYCGKVYSRKYGLKIHIRTHTGYKPLSCRVCHRAFGDPSNLNKHVRLHAEGATPYRCPHCGKVLVRRRDLARHLSSRHPDKPRLPDSLNYEEDTTTEGEEEDQEVEVEKMETEAASS